MEMTSLFADIDGFTSFVDKAIRNGSEAIKAAASAVHVILEELNDVLKDDFGGQAREIHWRLYSWSYRSWSATGRPLKISQADGALRIRHAIIVHALPKNSWRLG